jgi:adenosine kinase
MQPRPVVLTGSIAIDRIMSFGGRYSDHLHSEKLESVSVSIFLDTLTDSHGGVAANIAYGLTLLGDEPYLLGSVGKDGLVYMEELAHHGVNIAHVHESDLPTASFNVITDRDQNQVGGFYPGAMFDSDTLSLRHWKDHSPIIVLSPHDPKAMRRQVQECKQLGLTLCYDIGQQVSNAPAEDLRAGLDAAEVLIINEYELHVLSKRTGRSIESIIASVPLVVTTYGPNGSRIEGASLAEPIEIGAAPPTNVADPTGAGDAYRSGFLYGYARDWPLVTCGRLGAVCASFGIETLGTQSHAPTRQQIAERYEAVFDEQVPFDKTDE